VQYIVKEISKKDSSIYTNGKKRLQAVYLGMKNYVKTYLKYFGYDESDFIPCEVCQQKEVDIYPLNTKNIAKSKINLIDNLIALCRECHVRCDSDRAYNDQARLIHRKNLLANSNNEGDLIRY